MPTSERARADLALGRPQNGLQPPQAPCRAGSSGAGRLNGGRFTRSDGLLQVLAPDCGSPRKAQSARCGNSGRSKQVGRGPAAVRPEIMAAPGKTADIPIVRPDLRPYRAGFRQEPERRVSALVLGCVPAFAQIRPPQHRFGSSCRPCRGSGRSGRSERLKMPVCLPGGALRLLQTGRGRDHPEDRSGNHDAAGPALGKAPVQG